MTATRNPTRSAVLDPEAVDETSERWITAIHEAAHAVVAEHFGARVEFCRVTGDDTGLTRHTAQGPAHAVVAVAGERATRLMCGTGGGSGTDYRQATAVLHGSSHDIAWAEQQAEDAITGNRREIRRAAATLYRKGRR